MKNLKVFLFGIVLSAFIISSIGCDQESSDPVGVWKVISETNYTVDGQKTITYPRVNVNNKDIDDDGELEYVASQNYIEIKLDRLVVAVETELIDPGKPCELTTIKDGELKPIFIGTNLIKDGIITTTYSDGEQTYGMIFQYKLSDENLTLISIGYPTQKVKYVLEKVEESEIIKDRIESGIEILCQEYDMYCEFLSEDIVE